MFNQRLSLQSGSPLSKSTMDGLRRNGCGDAVRRPRDTDQALAVDVQQIAGRGVLVAHEHRHRLEITHPVSFRPLKMKLTVGWVRPWR